MIAIGTHFYQGGADNDRRQGRARAALLALPGVVPINLQFVDEGFRPDGFRTLPVLRQDSRTVTGAPGRRKPILSEMFDALAGAARDAGCRYFAYINADIQVTAAALEPILAGDHDAIAFSRTDVEAATGAELGDEIFGLDMFAIDAGWWARERGRFRPYIAGEACWDNVYAALICAHGRAEVISERSGIFHERHRPLWNDGPFAEYNGFLAALDAPYFSRWVHYATRLDQSRKAQTPVDRRRLARENMGDPRLSARETVVHAARQLRARIRYARMRAAASRPRSPRRSGPAKP